jgi:type IV pilus assembly protein PilM
MFMMHKKLLVGIDIGTHSIKVVRLKQKGKGYQLLNFGIMPLRPEAMVDGNISEAEAIVEAIRNLMRTEKITSKEVATAVSGQSVIVKRIRVPQMTEKELTEAIQGEAEQHIPFEISDVNIDFQVLPTVCEEDERADNQMDVLLVAAKKAKIWDYTNLLTAAGLSPVVVDIDVFALENEYEMTTGDDVGVVALVDIGATTMNINILKAGYTMFQRDIAIGGNRYTSTIQKELNVGYDQAEALKLGVGVSDKRHQEDLLSMMAGVSEEIAEEIQRSFEFFRTTAADEVIDRMVISGGCAKIKGLDRFLSNRLGLPVSVADPFRGLYYSDKFFDPEYLQDMAPVAAVSVGLALRRMHDR